MWKLAATHEVQKKLSERAKTNTLSHFVLVSVIRNNRKKPSLGYDWVPHSFHFQYCVRIWKWLGYFTSIALGKGKARFTVEFQSWILYLWSWFVVKCDLLLVKNYVVFGRILSFVYRTFVLAVFLCFWNKVFFRWLWFVLTVFSSINLSAHDN